jgi:LmbE family N-acetylglucosaminyl deacetylase
MDKIDSIQCGSNLKKAKLDLKRRVVESRFPVKDVPDKSRIVCICVILLLASAAFAQVRPINDYGALGLGQLLRKLQTTGSVLMIGAHPDDEDSALLAYLARGEYARTAYLSLTRGDGGQNIIGPELFESLGVIRTEELLQARRLDGAEQYFTRAYDYGFSKTLAEAKAKWPEEVIKCDVVRVIRLFKPLVVISRFSGTPRDGHGQHQYAGYITPIAVSAAADPLQCAGTGEPWKVEKFYIESGFGATGETTLRLNTGQFDQILGRTYFEIAMEGRSQHRSQGEGRIEFRGDSFLGLNLAGASKDLREKDIFDTLNVSPRVAFDDLSEIPDLTHPQDRILGGLLHYYKELRSRLASDGRLRFGEELEKATAAIRKATSIQIDALADSETVVPGSDLMVSIKAFVPDSTAIKFNDITLTAPNGWIVAKIEPPKQNNAAYNSRENAAAGAVFNVTAAKGAELTQPYWLRDQRKTDIFDWQNTPSQTLPFDPSLLVAHVTLSISGNDITLDQPVQYRYADPARGEIRREVNVVPALSVAVDRELIVEPISNKPQTRRLLVSVTNNSWIEQAGTVSLDIGSSPDIKLNAPQGLAFDLKTRGAKASIPIDVTIPQTKVPLDIPIRVSAVVGDANYRRAMNLVAYPHIQTHRFYRFADSVIRILDLKVSPLKVGYVMGSGDEVPDSIEQMGYDVKLLTEHDLSSGDLSIYQNIVIGIRAFETRPDMVANNARILDYVRNGGNVLVQYQRGNWSGLAPFSVSSQDRQGTAAGSISRVVDENAKVTILDPSNPAFNVPNKITDADFSGWVQERNAYNLVTFDTRFTPLLESHDAGEQENKGGLVIAKLGKGNWVYCSYSFFRQLPAGVPGAFRLFANLLSLPSEKK